MEYNVRIGDMNNRTFVFDHKYECLEDAVEEAKKCLAFENCVPFIEVVTENVRLSWVVRNEERYQLFGIRFINGDLMEDVLVGGCVTEDIKESIEKVMKCLEPYVAGFLIDGSVDVDDVKVVVENLFGA
jgi:hypothetical protein